MGRQGTRLADAGRWGDLGVLLATAGPALVDREPALLVLHAWLVGEHDGRYAEMLAMLARAEALLPGADETDPAVRALLGQIAVLRGTYGQLDVGDVAGTVALARRGQRLLCDHPGHQLASAHVLEALALANDGRYDEARRLEAPLLGDARFVDAATNPIVSTRPPGLGGGRPGPPRPRRTPAPRGR